MLIIINENVEHGQTGASSPVSFGHGSAARWAQSTPARQCALARCSTVPNAGFFPSRHRFPGYCAVCTVPKIQVDSPLEA